MAFKNLGSEGELFPQSVFIIASYDEDGTPNAMNAAWAGECGRHEICFNIGNHKTTANIVKRGAFTVSPADVSHVAEADYFGIATGNKVDKAAASGMTFTKSEFVDAPVIEEFPLTMECEVTAVEGDEHGAHRGPRSQHPCERVGVGRRGPRGLRQDAPDRLRQHPPHLPSGRRGSRRRLERGHEAHVAFTAACGRARAMRGAARPCEDESA
jgi:hypothetical protein